MEMSKKKKWIVFLIIPVFLLSGISQAAEIVDKNCLSPALRIETLQFSTFFLNDSIIEKAGNISVSNEANWLRRIYDILEGRFDEIGVRIVKDLSKHYGLIENGEYSVHYETGQMGTQTMTFSRAVKNDNGETEKYVEIIFSDGGMIAFEMDDYNTGEIFSEKYFFGANYPKSQYPNNVGEKNPLKIISLENKGKIIAVFENNFAKRIKTDLEARGYSLSELPIGIIAETFVNSIGPDNSAIDDRIHLPLLETVDLATLGNDGNVDKFCEEIILVFAQMKVCAEKVTRIAREKEMPLVVEAFGELTSLRMKLKAGTIRLIESYQGNADESKAIRHIFSNMLIDLDGAEVLVEMDGIMEEDFDAIEGGIGEYLERLTYIEEQVEALRYVARNISIIEIGNIYTLDVAKRLLSTRDMLIINEAI